MRIEPGDVISARVEDAYVGADGRIYFYLGFRGTDDGAVLVKIAPDAIEWERRDV